MSAIPWYKDFFGEAYMHMYAPLLSDATTGQEVEHIMQILNLPPGSSLLDLACGYGRHTIPLAQHGYHMTGFDLSETLLARAEAAATAQNVQVQWVQGDMRDIASKNEFDAVINIFTSFGYLESEDDHMQVLKQVQESLKPGGIFLLDTAYQIRFVRSFTPHSIVHYSDGLTILEERRFDLLTSRNEVKITLLYANGQSTQHSHSIRLYTLTELVSMLTAAGLTVQTYYGGLDRSPLTMDSRLVIVSRKDVGRLGT